LAHFLTQFVAGECVIAILLPRNTSNLYAGQLAILKSGAAYTCIDYAFPDEQIRSILRDSEASVLLTDEAGAARREKLGIAGLSVFDMNELMGRLTERAESPRPSWLEPSSLAYIIYTSGTTGRPKGVMIEHRSIANLVASDLDEFSLSPDDRVSQNS